MAGQESTGKCNLCGESFSKKTMTNHLNKCRKESASGAKPGDKKKTGKPKKAQVVHLLVEGRYLPEYWMHLELPAKATLEDLDYFLRDTWLECCGHLSAFRIGEDSYTGPVEAADQFGDQDMCVKLGEVLGPRKKFYHEYDFGTTTELALKVVSMAEGELRGRGVQVLARNDPPPIPCSSCGKPAAEVCRECLWDDKGWLCKKCASQHECGEEMLLPVVNSPRVGQCGYTGPEEHE